MSIKIGCPLPKTKKVIKIPFHVFDRCEIHNQAFLYVIIGKLIISNPHLRKIDFRNDIIKKKKNTHTQTNKQNKLHGTQTFEKFRNLNAHIYKNNIVPECSHIFLYFLKHFGIMK